MVLIFIFVVLWKITNSTVVFCCFGHASKRSVGSLQGGVLGQLGHVRVVGAPVDNPEQTHNAQHPYICHAVSGDREYFRQCL